MEVYAETQTDTHNRSTILAEALDAAGRGYAVFPLNAKVPAIKGGSGHKDASRDPREIISLFSAAGAKATGYGIRTGRASAIAVIDVDSAEGVAEVKRMGLHTEYVVRTGRERDGWHLYFRLPEGVALKGGKLGEHLRLQSDGQFVAGAGSMHPSGRTYEVVLDGEPAELPPELRARDHDTDDDRSEARPRPGQRPVNVEVGGPAIPSGERDDTLTKICGRLHDASRTLEDLISDLGDINRARCSPPLPDRQVVKIARSIFRRAPCKARPEVSNSVLHRLRYLREAAEGRAVRGMDGATGWSVYLAGLDALAEYGREHRDGLTLQMDARSWAQRAGTTRTSVSRFWRRSGLVRVLKRGSGRRPTVVLFPVPRRVREGHYLRQSSTRGDPLDSATSGSVTSNALQRTIYRLRWSGGSSKARRGVVKGTSRVREGAVPGRESVRRIGKSKAAILKAVVDCDDEVSLEDLADALGRKKRSMRAPLKWLIDAGLLVRPRRGYYATAPDFERRLSDARELAREPEADRLQMQRDAQQRKAYRRRGEGDEDQPETEPSAESVENVRRSRERREQHLREQARTQRQRAARRSEDIGGEYLAKSRRVEELVRQGMSRRWAEAEVFDPGGSPFRRGRESAECVKRGA
jgi:predicted transcriptional regulator